MARQYPTLVPELQEFITAQKLFFVATAPRQGRINLSPKGLDTFRVLDDRTVLYLDLTGSGNETAAHLLDDGRITFLFCSFDAKPLLLRLYGRGEVLHPAHPDFAPLLPRFPNLPGVRQLIRVRLDGCSTSCGFGVPEYDLREERTLLPDWATRQGEPALADYRRKHNRTSIDGLPTGLQEPTS